MKKRSIKYGGALTGIEEERAIMASVKKSGKTRNWQQGEQGALLEEELSEFLGVKHSVLTTSGSCAGLLALAALELPKGSEVIISAVTFPTIFNIILQCGLVPVVVDAEIGTYNFDLDEVEKAITPKTKAIIAVHALGNSVDWSRLRNIGRKYKVTTILDNCDGFSTTFKGKPVEQYADISFTSFHAAHIVSMGVGGGVFTDKGDLSKKVRMYRDWGRQANIDTPRNTKHKSLPSDYNPRFIYEKVGYNFQILDLQAAMGRVQLKRVAKVKKARKAAFDHLVRRLSVSDRLILPSYHEDADVCWFAFPLTVKTDRAGLLRHLEERGIETRPMFSGNITRHPAYKKETYRVSGKLRGSDRITSSSFWVSCHPALSKSDLEYLADSILEYVED